MISRFGEEIWRACGGGKGWGGEADGGEGQGWREN